MAPLGNYYDEGLLPNFEPKRKNLYIMSVAGIPAWQIKSTSRPQCMLNKVTVDYLNIKRHFTTGKIQWSDINITLLDPITPSGSQNILNWLQLQHDPATGRAGYASQYKKSITIDILGPGLQVVQKWDMGGCFVNGTIDFGDLDYSAQQTQQITFTLSMDTAHLIY